MEKDLYKVRSLSACMKAAYDMYRTNIKTIFRRTWLPALVFAVLASIAVVITDVNSYGDTTGAVTASDIVSVAACGIFILLALAADVWFFSIIVSLLNGSSMKVNLPRVIRLTLLIVAITIVVSAIATVASFAPLAGSMGKTASPAAIAAMSTILIGVYLLFLIALLPMIYSSLKYLMEPAQKVMSVIGKPYCTGWRHWGYLFMICLLAFIIISIINFIASLPLIITSFATAVNAAGMTLGDASGLPGYFKLLIFVSSLIFQFISIYTGAWFTMIAYYAYGHIEAKEKERKERKNAVQKVQSTEAEPDFEEIK